MPFLELASAAISKLVISIGSRTLGDKAKEAITKRRMARMIEDAVDRIVEQTEGYLAADRVSDERKEVLIGALCRHLQPLADNPQEFFRGDLDGQTLFRICHPDGALPEEVRHESLDQFYIVLFPQIAHFLAGSKVALAQWQAEGFREEFRRLSQLAEEIRSMNAKIADLPDALAGALTDRASQESETLLRELAQTLLTGLLLRLDLSPLRAERSLHGSLGDHFVIPAIQKRVKDAEIVNEEEAVLASLTMPGSRRVLHGIAGVGKTTVGLWLQARLLQSQQWRLAVLVRLRDHTAIDQESMLDILRQVAGAHLRDALTDKTLRRWFGNGRLVVILDGFDEIREDRRDAVERWIKSMGVTAKNTTIVVTSRPLQSGHLATLPKSWQHWNLLPFDQPRIVEFIERWHRYLPDGELSAAERRVDATSLAETFLADPSLRHLADTPLMLGTLLFVHHRDKQLPSGRVDLYERYIAAMLGLRDSGLGIQARATRLSDREKRQVLSHIAMHFHIGGVNEVNDTVMRDLVAQALSVLGLEEDVERLLAALRERTGLLQGPGAWSFMHKTISEFLVAELVHDGTSRLADGKRLDRMELWTHRQEDSWTAVIFFWAGKTARQELEKFITDLIESSHALDGTLALALLHDQGDRLDYITQRDFALRLVNREDVLGPRIPNDRSETVGYFYASSPDLPESMYLTIRLPSDDLRGLSSARLSTAVIGMVVRNVLRPSDVLALSPAGRDWIMLGSLWGMKAMQPSVWLASCEAFVWMSKQEVAFMLFHCAAEELVRRPGDVQTYFSDFVSAWLDFYPEGKGFVLPLLLGEARRFFDWSGVDAARLVGEMLRNRALQVDERWLLESEKCRSHEPGTYDVLSYVQQHLAVADKHQQVDSKSRADLADLIAELIALRRRRCSELGLQE